MAQLRMILFAALLLAALPAPQALASSSCREPFLPGEGVFQKMKASGDHYVQLSLRTPAYIGEEPAKEAMALRPFPQNSPSVYIKKTSEMRHSAGFQAERISRTIHEERISWRLEPAGEYDSLSVFEALRRFGHEALHFVLYEPAGLKAIIAIYSSALGQGASMGGTRVQDYASEAEGVMDALRLSEGMSYKAAAADIPAGGGKAVIFASPKTDKSIQLLRSYGEYLSVLNGLNQHKTLEGRPYFATGEDMGLTQEDLRLISQTGRGYLLGFLEKSEDPAILTAEGVFAGIKASARQATGASSLQGLSAAIQGAGNVGGRVAEKLVHAGAKVSVYDTDETKLQSLAKKTGARMISWQQALNEPHDIFVPCAGGGIVNAETVQIFKCKIIAGAANNQLAEPKYGAALKERGILYAPDYVINSGGLISVSRYIAPLDDGQDPAVWAREKTRGIYGALMSIFQTAEERGISPAEAADQLAKKKLRHAQSEMEARRREGASRGGFVSRMMWPDNQPDSQNARSSE